MKKKHRNVATWPVVVSGGRIIPPGAEVMVDDRDVHDCSLVKGGSLRPIIDPVPESDDDGQTEEL